MNAFEIVTVVVTLSALGIAILIPLRAGGARASLGHRGGLWFDHPEDVAVELKPSEDERDAPIPQRPLRGRPE